MQFIIHKRFKQKAICGNVNLPAGTICECDLNSQIISYDSKPLCMMFSENAHLYFSRNDDGKGMDRGRLISDIKRRLSKRDRLYEVRWDNIWNDELCTRFQRKDCPDFWLWNDRFYYAEINELEHILRLVSI